VGRLVCVQDSGAMAGVIAIDSIIRGRFQSASLSYGEMTGFPPVPPHPARPARPAR